MAESRRSFIGQVLRQHIVLKCGDPFSRRFGLSFNAYCSYVLSPKYRTRVIVKYLPRGLQSSIIVEIPDSSMSGDKLVVVLRKKRNDERDKE